MKLTIPIIGTVSVEGTLKQGTLIGSNDDPIRLVPINLGHVSWKLVDIDIEDEIAIIEVSPSDYRDIPTGRKMTLSDGKEVDETERRSATAQEKTEALQHAQGLVVGKTHTQLRSLTGATRLKRPNKVAG